VEVGQAVDVQLFRARRASSSPGASSRFFFPPRPSFFSFSSRDDSLTKRDGGNFAAEGGIDEVVEQTLKHLSRPPAGPGGASSDFVPCQSTKGRPLSGADARFH